MNGTPPVEFAAWIACLAFAVGLANGLLKLKGNVLGSAKKNEITPQPLVVQAAHDLVREKDCVSRHLTLEQQLVELRGQRIQDAKDASFSRKSVYGELESVRKEMGEMERRLNTADEQRTQALHSRINDILEAVGELRGKVQD